MVVDAPSSGVRPMTRQEVFPLRVAGDVEAAS
jgi:hypothetical protein